jgi:hypothetical protein
MRAAAAYYLKEVYNMTYMYETPNCLHNIELFPTSVLAKEIERSGNYVRTLIHRGIIPKTPFIINSQNYYSAEQISHIKYSLLLRAGTKIVYTESPKNNMAVPVGWPDNFSDQEKIHRYDLIENLTMLFNEYGIFYHNMTFVDAKMDELEFNEQNLKPMTKSAYNYKTQSIRLECGTYETLFPIGVLAKKLNRSPQCIKKWEASGILPETPFMTKHGHRRYSQEQIYLIAKCVELFNIKNGVSIKPTGFTEAVKWGYDILRYHYTNNILPDPLPPKPDKLYHKLRCFTDIPVTSLKTPSIYTLLREKCGRG